MNKREAINILTQEIFNDISNLKFKNLDIYSIEEDNVDTTFFDIENEDSDEKLKLLKQAYVTENYKDETILSLQKSLQSSSQVDVSKNLKLESYKKYNQALELANRKYITIALELIEESNQKNPKDTDILNLRGLLSILACKFSVAVESFYTSMCYKKDELSVRYVDILTSETFKTFMARYNHAIRFINEDMNDESIDILNNIIGEDADLIEPYVLLALLYDKLGDDNNKNYYLDQLRLVDKGHELIEIKEEKKEEEKIEPKENKQTSNNYKVITTAIIIVLLFGFGAYTLNNNKKLDELNNEISKKEEELDEMDKQLNDKDNAEEEIVEEEKIEEEKAEDKETEPEKEEVVISEELTEVQAYDKAVTAKKNKDYASAIAYFEKAIENGSLNKYKSQAMIELAMIHESQGNDDKAISYYNKYIVAYPGYSELYDDALYNLGMLYYDNDDLANAKKIFHILKSEEPNSMYFNSRVKEILSM